MPTIVAYLRPFMIFKQTKPKVMAWARIVANWATTIDWAQKGFASPSPIFVKHSCLKRNGYPNATWVETGTYLGETTSFLSKLARKVFSIEPEPALFSNAKLLFGKKKNVEILNGTSEDILPSLLPKISGDVNFWLDGHYSMGITYKGERDTPIIQELAAISDNFSHFDKVCVLIDDVRCFNPQIDEYSTYPHIDTLIIWAKKHQLTWHIEHDIFVAKTTS